MSWDILTPSAIELLIYLPQWEQNGASDEFVYPLID